MTDNKLKRTLIFSKLIDKHCHCLFAFDNRLQEQSLQRNFSDLMQALLVFFLPFLSLFQIVNKAQQVQLFRFSQLTLFNQLKLAEQNQNSTCIEDTIFKTKPFNYLSQEQSFELLQTLYDFMQEVCELKQKSVQEDRAIYSKNQDQLVNKTLLLTEAILAFNEVKYVYLIKEQTLSKELIKHRSHIKINEWQQLVKVARLVKDYQQTYVKDELETNKVVSSASSNSAVSNSVIANSYNSSYCNSNNLSQNQQSSLDLFDIAQLLQTQSDNKVKPNIAQEAMIMFLYDCLDDSKNQKCKLKESQEKLSKSNACIFQFQESIHNEAKDTKCSTCKAFSLLNQADEFYQLLSLFNKLVLLEYSDEHKNLYNNKREQLFSIEQKDVITESKRKTQFKAQTNKLKESKTSSQFNNIIDFLTSAKFEEYYLRLEENVHSFKYSISYNQLVMEFFYCCCLELLKTIWKEVLYFIECAQTNLASLVNEQELYNFLQNFGKTVEDINQIETADQVRLVNSINLLGSNKLSSSVDSIDLNKFIKLQSSNRQEHALDSTEIRLKHIHDYAIKQNAFKSKDFSKVSCTSSLSSLCHVPKNHAVSLFCIQTVSLLDALYHLYYLSILPNLLNNFKDIALSYENKQGHYANLLINKSTYSLSYIQRQDFHLGIGLHPCFTQYSNLIEQGKLLKQSRLLELEVTSLLSLLDFTQSIPKFSSIVTEVGEVGLDKHSSLAMSKQLEILESFIYKANKLNLDCSIHCVKAYNELICLVKQFQKHTKTKRLEHIKECGTCMLKDISQQMSFNRTELVSPRAQLIVHGFNGSVSIAKQLLEQKIALSFGRALLAPQNANKFKEVIALVTNNALLKQTEFPVFFETDFDGRSQYLNKSLEAQKNKQDISFASYNGELIYLLQHYFSKLM